jgi:hypothetical protein
MRRKPSQTPTGRLPSLRLFSTLLALLLVEQRSKRVIASLENSLTTPIAIGRWDRFPIQERSHARVREITDILSIAPSNFKGGRKSPFA